MGLQGLCWGGGWVNGPTPHPTIPAPPPRPPSSSPRASPMPFPVRLAASALSPLPAYPCPSIVALACHGAWPCPVPPRPIDAQACRPSPLPPFACPPHPPPLDTAPPVISAPFHIAIPTLSIGNHSTIHDIVLWSHMGISHKCIDDMVLHGLFSLI